MEGEYFEACNCEVACPCVFGSDPTPGTCTVILAFHIERGSAGSHSLEGLNFAFAIYSPGSMGEGNWETAIYLDERATDAQRATLEPILSGKAGGMFAVWASAYGTLHAVRSVPIDFQAEGKRRSLEIVGVGETSIRALDRRGGQDTKIIPGSLTPEVTVAKSEKLTWSDYGWNWKASGKNGFYAPFSARGP